MLDFGFEPKSRRRKPRRIAVWRYVHYPNRAPGILVEVPGIPPTLNEVGFRPPNLVLLDGQRGINSDDPRVGLCRPHTAGRSRTYVLSVQSRASTSTGPQQCFIELRSGVLAVTGVGYRLLMEP